MNKKSLLCLFLEYIKTTDPWSALIVEMLMSIYLYDQMGSNLGWIKKITPTVSILPKDTATCRLKH